MAFSSDSLPAPDATFLFLRCASRRDASKMKRVIGWPTAELCRAADAKYALPRASWPLLELRKYAIRAGAAQPEPGGEGRYGAPIEDLLDVVVYEYTPENLRNLA